MNILHAKTPDGTQKDIDLDKIFTTDGGTINGSIELCADWTHIGSTANTSMILQHDKLTQGFEIWSGNSLPAGASLILRGALHDDGGKFYLAASNKIGDSDTDTSHTRIILEGDPNGSLKWNGKEVERINASSLAHSGYIRYESGLQICWGTVTVNKSYTANQYDTRTWTYPVAFNTEPIVLCNSRHDRFNVGTNNSPIGNSSCTIYSVNTHTSSTFTLSYIDCFAIGKWK